MVGPPIPPDEEFVGPPAPAVPLGAPAQPTVPGPTLGDVQAAVNPEDDVEGLYNYFRERTRQLAAQNFRAPLSAEQRPGILQNVLTFGMAGLYHGDYERGYNRKIEEHNAAVAKAADQQALGLVRETMRGRQADIGLQMRLLGLQMQQQQNQLQMLDAQERRARQGFNDATVSLPLTEEQRAALADQGLIAEPVPGTSRARVRPLAGAAGAEPSSEIGAAPGGVAPSSFVTGLRARGFSSEEAAAIGGNVHVESGFNPSIEGPPGEGSFGLMQWRGPRLSGLKKYAASRGKDWRDPEMQMDWIGMERSGKSVDWGSTDERAAYARGLRGGSPAAMAISFGQHVERPANLGATAKERARAARNLYGGREGAAAPTAGGPETTEQLRQRRAEEKRREEQAKQEAKPLEAEDRKVVASMLRLRTLMKRTMDEFTPEERAKYVGVLRNPAMRAKQFITRDPKFQQWQALVGQMQTLRFELAGAALTKNESQVLERFLPTGTEVGGSSEFETKSKEFYKSSLDAIRGRLAAARGRGTLEEEIAAEPTELETPPPSPAAATEAPAAAPAPSAAPARTGTTRSGVQYRILD